MKNNADTVPSLFFMAPNLHTLSAVNPPQGDSPMLETPILSEPIVAEYLKLAEQYPQRSVPWRRWAYHRLLALRERYREVEGYDVSDEWMGLPEISPPE
jgi:hypothetical protein